MLRHRAGDRSWLTTSFHFADMDELRKKFEMVLDGSLPEDALTDEELIQLEMLVMDAISLKMGYINLSQPQVIH